jgi:hypothetical protein
MRCLRKSGGGRPGVGVLGQHGLFNDLPQTRAHSILIAEIPQRMSSVPPQIREAQMQCRNVGPECRASFCEMLYKRYVGSSPFAFPSHPSPFL